MESGKPAKRRYIAYGVNESLLELAVKLKEAEVRVNGRTLQTAVPPRNVLPDVSSTVDRGRFQFVARRNHFTSDYIDSNKADVTAESVRREVDTNEIFACTERNAIEEDIAAVPPKRKKLSVPNRDGPSLWPFLSSVKSSVDAEHVKFLEKNRQFYSNYDKFAVIEDYIEPLSESDFGIIIDSAIDTVLQTRESRVLQQSRSSKNEPCIHVPTAVAVAPMPLLMNDDIDLAATFETDDISTSPAQPAVVSKRYAAAVANPRRFRCGLCPYSTNNRSHVRRHHLSVHSDSRPYRCYVCGKEFARCENAKVHMSTRHPEVPYDVDRLRNTMYFKSDATIQAAPSKEDLEPSANTQSSSVPVPNSAYQLQKDALSSGISAQLPSDSLAMELHRARFDRHQTILPWLNFAKTEPKLDQSLPVPVLGHVNTSNQLLEAIPRSLFQAPANTVRQSVGPIKQEPGPQTDTKVANFPVANRHVCLYCQCVYQSAIELANHIATSHSGLNPALHAAPGSNPGYVVLQTAAPIFLFPYGSDSVLPNKSPVGVGYPPILPKLPIHSNEGKSGNEASVGQHASSAAKAPSMGNSSITPEKAQSHSSSTPASSEVKRERKRQFKTFYCNRCPDRAPFRYEKSFEKHLKQHRLDDRCRRAQKIVSKIE